ncbi:MAG TPA: phosphomannomutase/phosphoglucomutase, partial [Candidatus Saccharimonadia bacterium]|nr:phosphomannomutase/phosphoglucomutase [Candidatus Saccharimonadia bacterium]
CFMQAQAVMRDRRASAAIDASREAAAARIGAQRSKARAEVARALDDDALRAALATSDEASRARARLRMRERLPGLAEISFYGPELYELLSVDLPSFGYARANALTQAKTRGDGADVQYRADASGSRLAFAEPVKDGDRIVAFVYLETRAAEVLAPLSGADVVGGSLAMTQSQHLRPDAVAPGGAELKSTRVPQTTMVLSSIASDHFRVGDAFPLIRSENVPMLLSLAALATLVAFATIRWRGASLATRAIAAVRARRAADDAGVEVTAGAKPAPRQVRIQEPSRVDETAPAAAMPSATRADAGATPDPASVRLERSIFRAYDIRGVVGDSLTPEVAKLIGQSVGTIALERGLNEIVVGRDGRLSGPMLSDAIISGLCASGCNVIDIGPAPTPVLYFATYHLNTGSGISVTGSHNPPDYNGFKIMLGTETLAEQGIQDIYIRIAEGRLATGDGQVQRIDVKQAYIERISGDVQLERKLKVVLDAGNGIAGAFAPDVMAAIGCEVEPLFCDVDGTFPNHHPDPGEPKNLQDLIVAVKQLKADIGLAFDGDGDRLGVVTTSGEIIYPDRLLMLFAIDVLTRAPGAPIIYDVKCTGHLQDLILRHGGSPIMWKTGHSLIKAKMRIEDAELAGEMSGHFFFRERWFGFDDGIYAAARLCEIIATSGRSAQELFDELPKGVSTPELKIPMAEGAHYAFIERFRERANFPDARITTIDGVRADYADGWGLVRCSNTTPSLVLRFDADSAEALLRIEADFRAQLLALDPGLRLPF